MEFRRIKPPDEVAWENPIVAEPGQPCLSDVVRPADLFGHNAADSAHRFRVHFSDARRTAKKDAAGLEGFIRNPQYSLFVIWGDVGIGKTFFVMNRLLAGREGRVDPGSQCFAGGIVDFLKGGAGQDMSRSVMRQICPILDDYFGHYHSGTYDAALIYAKHLVSKRKPRASDNEIALSAKGMVTQVLANENGERYANFLLETFEYLAVTPLFIVIDNIDKALDSEQGILLRIATRLLRYRQIRLVVPLRKTSSMLGDRFRCLNETRYASMELSPLDLMAMIKIRFEFDGNGTPLGEVSDGERSYSWPAIYRMLFEDEAGDRPGRLLIQLCEPSARTLLQFVDHVLKSDQLKGLRNLMKAEYVIAALMLSNNSTADTFDTFILNLFENDEPGVAGNTLIRFRVLEYFHTNRTGSPNDAEFNRFFRGLGYDVEKVIGVLALFVSRNLVGSGKSLEPRAVLASSLQDLGSFSITSSGDAYFNVLLRSIWYYVAVKRAVQLPARYISYDSSGKHEFVKHNDLMDFLQEAEHAEKTTRRSYERANGENQKYARLAMPSAMAKDVLIKRPQQREQ